MGQHPDNAVDAVNLIDTRRQRAVTLLIVCAATTLNAVDNTVINLALPSISRSLGATAAELQWIVGVFGLVLASLLITGGALGDRFGAQRTFRVGVAGAAMFSLVATQATSPSALIVCRCALGLSAALISPSALAILTQTFVERESRAKAIGIWAGVASAGLAVGPIVGGLLLSNFWWGSVFLINAPCSFLLLIASRSLPAAPGDRSRSFDPLGSLLSFVAFASILWMFIEGPGRGWTDPRIGGALIVGVGVSVLFVRWERRNANAMLDLALFSDRAFTAGTLASIIIGLANGGSVFVIVQYLQSARGESPFTAGMHLIPYAVGMAISAFTAAPLSTRFGRERTFVISLALSAAGFAGMALLQTDTPYVLIAIGLFVVALGFGASFAVALTLALSRVAPTRSGVAGAMNNTVRQAAQAASIAVVGTVVAVVYRAGLSGERVTEQLDPEVREQLGKSVAAGIRVAGTLGGGRSTAVRELVRNAYTGGMRMAFVGSALVAAGAMLLVRLFPRVDRNSSNLASSTELEAVDGDDFAAIEVRHGAINAHR